MTYSNFFTGSAVLCLAVVVSGDVKAQDLTGTAVIGLGASFGPVFNGSSETEVSPDPIIDARIGRFFIGELGVGVDLLQGEGANEFTFGAAIRPGEGRNESDDAAFAGLGDLDEAVELVAFAEAEFGPVELGANLATDVGSGHGGTTLQLGAGFENEMSDRWSYEVEFSTVLGDAFYVRSLYGVSNAQAASSAYTAFSPSAGFAEASIDVSFRYTVNENWFLEAGFGFGTLLGDARDAPFLSDETFTRASIGVARAFQF